eukprot:TRINITY_DN25758_c0_g1_i1.p1 TRINITY_DN25758_c0_g1~~TRINITY_DN25758_c0_g1_i1.p1  ORF type:complete len:161 (+),score=20.64 TRINITY_DN25758_c0_g1_i1:173-655(+)
MAPEIGSRLTSSQVKNLMRDLHSAYEEPAFQLSLLTMRQQDFPSRPAMMAAARQAALVAQGRVLPNYGFEPTVAGVDAMVKALTNYFIIEDTMDPRKASMQAKAVAIGWAAHFHREDSPGPSMRRSWQWPTQMFHGRGGSWETASTCVPDTEISDISVDA